VPNADQEFSETAEEHVFLEEYIIWLEVALRLWNRA